MKITVYSTKGSAGKTPIATNIALDRSYAVWTNEPYHIFDGFIPDNQLLSLDLNDTFPTIPDDVDIVFDLAGSISKTAYSITSAIKQSDVVLVPIYNEVKSIKAGLNTIAEVMNFNKNVIVIATKLQKRKKTDVFKSWAKSDDFLNIQNAVHSQIGKNIPVLPLKFSAVFDAIFEQEKSIKQLMEVSGLARYQYREVSEQFDAIYNLIDTKYAK